MKKRLLFFLLLISTGVFANDSLVISRLLQRIDDLQPKEDGVFPKGSIPSYRLYSLNKDRYKADINPFFTGLVAFTLQDIMGELSPAQRQQANAIINRTMSVYPKFRNKTIGRNTYNFWPTDTPQIFPHAGWMNMFNKSQALPDDLDDTVILLMAQKVSDSVAKEIHALMQSFINDKGKKINNTFEEYKNIGAYSTWFGKKMPVDFEIGVLANILYFVQQYNLPWTAADSASCTLIRKIIADKKHITAANYISPHYVKLPIILYHVSRLMAVRPIPELEKLKPQLVEETTQALLSADNFMDEVLLSTSLLRWGVTPPELAPRKANSLEELVEDEKFSFFIANIASMLPNPLKQWVGSIGLGRFYYYSPAYNNLLLVENLAWRKRRGLR
jgi:hypothetical protein